MPMISMTEANYNAMCDREERLREERDAALVALAGATGRVTMIERVLEALPTRERYDALRRRGKELHYEREALELDLARVEAKLDEVAAADGDAEGIASRVAAAIRAQKDADAAVCDAARRECVGAAGQHPAGSREHMHCMAWAHQSSTLAGRIRDGVTRPETEGAAQAAFDAEVTAMIVGEYAETWSMSQEQETRLGAIVHDALVRARTNRTVMATIPWDRAAEAANAIDGEAAWLEECERDNGHPGLASTLRALAVRVRDLATPATVTTTREERYYLTDDCDQCDMEMRLSSGGNGDWYLSILPQGDLFTRQCVRITTSGSRYPGAAAAIAMLYRAMTTGSDRHRSTVTTKRVAATDCPHGPRCVECLSDAVDPVAAADKEAESIRVRVADAVARSRIDVERECTEAVRSVARMGHPAETVNRCITAIRTRDGGRTDEAALDGRPRPRVVCLCGSTRFWKEFQRVGLEETRAGRIVLSIGAATASDTEHLAAGIITQADKDAFDELHLRKIDICDEVLVLNVGSYCGESTRREIGYARQLGRTIRWLEPPDQGQSGP